MMIRKVFLNNYFIEIIIFATLNIALNGCYSLRETEITSGDVVKIYKVELTDGEIVDFQNTEPGYGFISTDKIVSIDKKGETKEIPMSKVKKAYTEKFDFGKTFFLGIGIIAGLYLALIGLFIIAMGGRSFGG